MNPGLHHREMLRPGWAEVALGLMIFAVAGFGGGSLLDQVALAPTTIGLMFTGLSGVAGLLGFSSAFLLRVRDPAAFGVRGTSLGWLLLAVAAGVLAFLIKGLLVLAFPTLFEAKENVQQVYATAGSGGPASLLLAIVLLAVVTPIGEELLFRGVLTSALLRYGAFIAVAGSSAVFAAMHGLNSITPSALVEGLVAAETFRRSGSVWTAVTVHIVFNLPTVPVLVLNTVG